MCCGLLTPRRHSENMVTLKFTQIVYPSGKSFAGPSRLYILLEGLVGTGRRPTFATPTAGHEGTYTIQSQVYRYTRVLVLTMNKGLHPFSTRPRDTLLHVLRYTSIYCLLPYPRFGHSRTAIQSHCSRISMVIRRWPIFTAVDGSRNPCSVSGQYGFGKP